jgi:DNA adenine methylase
MKEQSIMKPLFAWVGGKQRLADQILPLVPREFRAYHEPFCGSAALFLAMDLHKKDVFLNDKNTGLISLHRALHSHLEPLRAALREIRAEYVQAVKGGTARDFFNAKRVTYNEMKARGDGMDAVRLASIFLFLVKSSYGSLYRENKSGDFNASFALNGNCRHTFLNMSLDDLDAVHAYMNRQRSVTMSCMDYREAIRNAKRGDFVFLDPPYWIEKKGDFTQYSRGRFDSDDQHNVFRAFEDLTRRGCKVLLMNSNIGPVRELYKDFHQVPIYAVRSLQLKSNIARAPVELAITNYVPPSATGASADTASDVSGSRA